MDVEACLERLHEAIRDGEVDEARDAAEDLALWVAGGGFLPAALTDKDTTPRDRQEETRS